MHWSESGVHALHDSWAMMPPRVPFTEARAHSRRLVGLGAARAATQWEWAEPVPLRFPGRESPRLPAASEPYAGEHVLVRVPVALLREMTAAAYRAGRTEGEVWAEAARLWLERRMRGDGPQPPDPAAPAMPLPRRSRAWSGVDAVMSELRQARSPATTPRRPPAA